MPNRTLQVIYKPFFFFFFWGGGGGGGGGQSEVGVSLKLNRKCKQTS